MWNSRYVGWNNNFVFTVQVRFVSSRLSNPLEFQVRSSSLEERQPETFEVESTEWEGSQLGGAPINEWEGGSQFTETFNNGEWEGGDSQFPPPPSHPPPSAPSLNDFYPHVESFDSPPPALAPADVRSHRLPWLPAEASVHFSAQLVKCITLSFTIRVDVLFKRLQ